MDATFLDRFHINTPTLENVGNTSQQKNMFCNFLLIFYFFSVFMFMFYMFIYLFIYFMFSCFC
jgi:hypothetical protein